MELSLSIIFSFPFFFTSCANSTKLTLSKRENDVLKAKENEGKNFSFF